MVSFDPEELSEVFHFRFKRFLNHFRHSRAHFMLYPHFLYKLQPLQHNQDIVNPALKCTFKLYRKPFLAHHLKVLSYRLSFQSVQMFQVTIITGSIDPLEKHYLQVQF